MRIAVCDDCNEDAMFLKKCLAGHEVGVYSGADSLLTDIEEKKVRYDLYLLDIFMGESINGIELAEKLYLQQQRFLPGGIRPVCHTVSDQAHTGGCCQETFAECAENLCP